MQMSKLLDETVSIFNKGLLSAQVDLEWKYEVHDLYPESTNEMDVVKEYLNRYIGISINAINELLKNLESVADRDKGNQLITELREVFQDFYWLEADEYEIFMKIHDSETSTDILGNIESSRSGLL